MRVDTIAAGKGPTVILLHSSVSGARQWRRLIADLENRYHVVAVNMMGYGATPSWKAGRPMRLDDQVDHVEAVLPPGDGSISIVGHSYGGTVAMKAAARFGARIRRLVLLEPNPFFLLKQAGRSEAFAEAMTVCGWIRTAAKTGDWSTAAVPFADYWGGPGSWQVTPPDRRESFIEALKPNFHEWDSVLAETMPLEVWSRSLPEATMHAMAARTVRPIVEIGHLMQGACPHWRFETYAEGGHMAPLTHPALINPIVAGYLDH